MALVIASTLERLKIVEVLQSEAPSAMVLEYTTFKKAPFAYEDSESVSTFMVLFSYPDLVSKHLLIRIADDIEENVYRVGVLLNNFTKDVVGKKFASWLRRVDEKSLLSVVFKRKESALSAEYVVDTVAAAISLARNLVRNLVSMLNTYVTLKPNFSDLAVVPNSVPSKVETSLYKGSIVLTPSEELAVLLEIKDKNAIVGLLDKFEKRSMNLRVLKPYVESLNRTQMASLARMLGRYPNIRETPEQDGSGRPMESLSSQLFSSRTLEMLRSFNLTAGDIVSMKHGDTYVVTELLSVVNTDGKVAVRHPYFPEKRLMVTYNKVYPTTPKERMKYIENGRRN